jgi:lambda repressor-like predicted transcriptional regulator
MNQAATNRCIDMDPTEIKVAMLRAGVTQKEIALSLDPPVSRQAVHLVVNCKASSRRIRTAIADALGIELSRIWPSACRNGGKTCNPDHVSAFSDE